MIYAVVACHKYELIFNSQQVLEQWNYMACKDDEQTPKQVIQP